MKAGVLKETWPGETRVAVVPGVVTALAKAGIELLIESGAGDAAGFPDAQYAEKGASVVRRDEVLAGASLLLVGALVRGSPRQGRDRAARAAPRARRVPRPAAAPRSREGAGRPRRDFLRARAGAAHLARPEHGRAVLDRHHGRLQGGAARRLQPAAHDADDDDRGRHDRAGPRLRDRRGRRRPAGDRDGARGSGAVVEAYDVRPAVKEQIHSLGAKFVELPLETAAAEDKGGYAKAQDEELLPPPARAAREGGRRERRGDQRRGGARQEGAGAGDERDAARDASRLGDRGPRRGAGRQLRGEPGRRGGRRARGARDRPAQPGGHDPAPREPAVREEPCQLRPEHDEEGRAADGGRRRDRQGQHAHPRRRGGGRAGARGARHGAAACPRCPPEPRPRPGTRRGRPAILSRTESCLECEAR